MRYAVTIFVITLIFLSNAWRVDAFSGEKKWKDSSNLNDLTLSLISRRSDRCVMVSGRKSVVGNFFVDICLDSQSYKQLNSIGYVHDLQFLDESKGWMILSGSIVQIKDFKLLADVIPDAQNTGYRKLFFTNDMHGCAVGYEGSVICTENGGRNWSRSVVAKEFNLREVEFSSRSKGWIVGADFERQGNSMILLRTTNGGRTWSRVNQKAEQEIERLEFLSANDGWATRRDNVFMITSNGGLSWIPTPYRFANIKDVYFTNKLVGWLLDNQIFETRDGGCSWKLVREFPKTTSPFDFDQIVMLNDRDGFLMSLDQVVRTTDGGLTWSPVDLMPEN